MLEILCSAADECLRRAGSYLKRQDGKGRMDLASRWKDVPAQRKFQLFSALSLFLVFLLLFPILQTVIKEYYVQLNPSILAEQVQLISKGYLSPEDFEDARPERLLALERALAEQGMGQLRVWDARGEVLHAENHSMIGLRFPENERFQQAMLGLTVIEVDPEGKAGGNYQQPMEIYVPMLFPDIKGPAGVIEIHQDVDTLTGILHTTRVKLVFFFLVSLVILYFILNAVYAESQRSMETALRELRLTSAKKNDFISIAAHELKTPITVIRGYAQLLQLKGRGVPPKVREVLDTIEKETERLESQINEMLDISRIDLQTLNFVYEETNVRAFLEERAGDIEQLARKKSMTFELQLGPGLGSAIIDKDRVWQVILNLAVNAIKFSPEGKRVWVKASRDKDTLLFSVKDEGPGIPRQFHTKIFERLYQVDPASTRRQGGLGLGLAICRGFIEAMGGRLWLQSEAGKGAEFSFTVPARRAPS